MVLRIKKGINLQLAGKIEDASKVGNPRITRIAMTPDDFPGMIPKPEVKEGDTVKTGQPLWHHKANDSIKVVSPVDGIVRAIVRGEKRKILRVEVDVDSNSNQPLPTEDIPTRSVDFDNIVPILKETGIWAMIRQLPFDIIPVEGHQPVNIFVSAWDAAPLSVGFNTYLTPQRIEMANIGAKALSHLTKGKVYIGFSKKFPIPSISNATMVEMDGPYPASLPSILAANIAPVNKGETVWLLGIETLVRVGQAISGMTIDWSFPVAMVGSEFEKPAILEAPAGAKIEDLLAACPLKCCNHNIRIISGNVFVGEKVSTEGYLRYPYRQVTAIPEGDDSVEFMGWASMSPSKMSRSRSFPSFFFRNKEFKPDARLNGGRRAMIMSGEYDRYIPMDIMAEYLIKAILSRDIERMEQLGIYEVTPEDFSAAEYADTSKLELQKIVREGLDYMIKEVGTDN